MPYDDSHWDRDDNFLRSVEREPSYSTRHRPSHLDARGSVKQATRPDCATTQHDAQWDSMRRDGLVAYASDTVLEQRTCLVCRGSYSRDVDCASEEALDLLRREGLL